MGRINQPLTNEAARKLMALDVQDKEILTYDMPHIKGTQTVYRPLERPKGEIET